MSFKGVETNKLNQWNGGGEPNTDGINALVFVVATADLPVGAAHNTFYKLFQPKDAEDLGFNAAFDANEDKLVHHEVVEHFTDAPDQPVYIVAVADSQTPAAIMAVQAFKNNLKATKEVKGLLFQHLSETLLTIDDQAELVQAQIDILASEEYNLDFVVLPAKGESTIQAISAYPNIRALNAPNVSISVAQDPLVAAIDATYAKYAAIGAISGMLAIRKVSENLGSTDIANKPPMKKGDLTYPLTRGTRWASGTLSDGKKFSDLTPAEKQSLTDKGYIYAGYYEGFPGLFFNDSPTCCPESSNYARIENNRTWNKAKRAIRTALLPKVKGKIPKDPATGFLRTTATTSLENIVKKVLDQMVTDGDLSGYQVKINHKQVLNSQNGLKVQVELVMDDIIYKFVVDMGNVKQLS